MMADNPIDWEALDWTKQDVVLARELSFSRDYIRQIRNLLGKPKAKRHYQRSYQTKEQTFLAVHSSDKTVEELCRITGLAKTTVWQYLSKHGLKAKHSSAKYDWSAVDWSKGNRVLSKEIGSHENFISMRRKQYAPKQYKNSSYQRQS